MSISLKIAIAAVCLAVLLIGGVCMFMYLPRAGKPNGGAWRGEESYDDSKVKSLIKTVGEDFRILQLTDIQFTTIVASRTDTFNTITKLIEQTKPSLIVLTGDNVAGLTTHFSVNYLIDFMDGFELPWAPVFGNHDRELSSNLYYQGNQYEKSKYCLFSQGPENIAGVGNYVVNIKQDDKTVYTMFLIDSNGSRDYEIDGKKVSKYDYIYPSQINWYKDNVNAITALNGGVQVPSMAFFHIALQEFKTAYDLAKAGDPQAEILYGERREDECPAYENTGFFDTIVNLGSTTHIMVGHDHVNDYAVKYKDIVMGYGVKTGNHSYYDAAINGGTLLTIKSDYSVDIQNVYIAI